ncbi:MAG TPA: dihydroneopterin aldolase [Chitinophagaceae bacterium]|jgi:dihydroneopterin aldolase|nr:dihydroneopterin aldolase [Chitinophagaceae bacterium]
MNNTITIKLNKLLFFAYHGLFPEEKKIGAEFEVNLEVSYHPVDKITALEETIDYGKLYQLLKAEMQKPRELLETFVMEVAQIIYLSYPSIKKIELSVTKLQAPIAGFTGNVAVQYSKEF